MKPSKEEVLEQLQQLAKLSWEDPAEAHANADSLLLKYIDDGDISPAYSKVWRLYE